MNKMFYGATVAGLLSIAYACTEGGGGVSSGNPGGPSTPGGGTPANPCLVSPHYVGPNSIGGVRVRSWNRSPVSLRTQFSHADFGMNVPRGFGNTVATLILNAVVGWSNATGGSGWYPPLFAPFFGGIGSGSGDVTFRLTDTFTQLEPGTRVTGTTDWNLDGQERIVSATITLGSLRYYGFNPNNPEAITVWADDLAKTAAHEWGHAMGVVGHSPNGSDIMSREGNGTSTVTRADINTLYSGECPAYATHQ